MCARGGGGADSCTGDSGGPLMARKGNTWQLEGGFHMLIMMINMIMGGLSWLGKAIRGN